MASTRLPMPVLVLTGAKASGNFLIEQAKLVASDVRGQVVMGSGRWLMEEAPDKVNSLRSSISSIDGRIKGGLWEIR